MTDPLPSNALVAIATVVAAVIAGLISVVALTLTKEQKTSEFRQAWIDGLRSDLADYLAAARAMARVIEEAAAFGDKYAALPFTIPPDQVGEIRRNVAVSLYRIKLRLNPDEKEHQELLRLLGSVSETQKQAVSAPLERTAAMLQAVETAADYSRPILKAEWRRVKAGEPQFRLVRNWLVPVVFALCAFFAWLIVSVKIAA
ncbi:hypothetical protein Pnap_3109 [Polaromonas naphthalenivorans CJ2]|uniref:Uncharacterized protein n=1 Tax=Polaromonas naphthalenivorans (strain CJ2) TaxID=365044 RepID=A1VRY0_POLNA|nr:hypothetical protein Pnap_3109 [Polaromonas naphthalenivorans CJ2]